LAEIKFVGMVLCISQLSQDHITDT